MTENQRTGEPKVKRRRVQPLVTVLTHALLVGAAVSSFVIPDTLPVVESSDQSIDRHPTPDPTEQDVLSKPRLHHVPAPASKSKSTQ